MRGLLSCVVSICLVISTSLTFAQGAPPDVLSWGQKEWYRTAYTSSGEVGWVLVTRGPNVQDVLAQTGLVFFSSAQQPVLLLIVRWGIKNPGILSLEAWIRATPEEWEFSGVDSFRVPPSAGRVSLVDLSSPAGEVFSAWARGLGVAEDEVPSVVPYITTEERKLFWWFPKMVRTEAPPWFR